MFYFSPNVFHFFLFFPVPKTSMEFMAPSFLDKIYESHIVMAQVFIYTFFDIAIHQHFSRKNTLDTLQHLTAPCSVVLY